MALPAMSGDVHAAARSLAQGIHDQAQTGTAQDEPGQIELTGRGLAMLVQEEDPMAKAMSPTGTLT